MAVYFFLLLALPLCAAESNRETCCSDDDVVVPFSSPKGQRLSPIGAERAALDIPRISFESDNPAFTREYLLLSLCKKHSWQDIDKEAMMRLLNAGVDVETPHVFAQQKPWVPALAHAALQGNWWAVQQLLKHDADPNVIYEREGTIETALHAACLLNGAAEQTDMVNYISVVTLLCKARADVHHGGYQGMPYRPLHVLLGRTKVDAHLIYVKGSVIATLCAYGAQVNVTTIDGKTALDIALERKDPDMIALLRATYHAKTQSELEKEAQAGKHVGAQASPASPSLVGNVYVRSPQRGYMHSARGRYRGSPRGGSHRGCTSRGRKR